MNKKTLAKTFELTDYYAAVFTQNMQKREKWNLEASKGQSHSKVSSKHYRKVTNISLPRRKSANKQITDISETLVSKKILLLELVLNEINVQKRKIKLEISRNIKKCVSVQKEESIIFFIDFSKLECKKYDWM